MGAVTRNHRCILPIIGVMEPHYHAWIRSGRIFTMVARPFRGPHYRSPLGDQGADRQGGPHSPCLRALPAHPTEQAPPAPLGDRGAPGRRGRRRRAGSRARRPRYGTRRRAPAIIHSASGGLSTSRASGTTFSTGGPGYRRRSGHPAGPAERTTCYGLLSHRLTASRPAPVPGSP